MFIASKLLRTEKCKDQIDKKPQRRDAGNDVIHGFLYNLSQAFVKAQHRNRNKQPMAM